MTLHTHVYLTSLYSAALYNNVVERTASEFAVDYTNQQMLTNSVQLTMLEVNMIMNNTGELSSMV